MIDEKGHLCGQRHVFLTEQSSAWRITNIFSKLLFITWYENSKEVKRLRYACQARREHGNEKKSSGNRNGCDNPDWQ